MLLRTLLRGCLFLLIACFGLLQAQTGSGKIQGTVVDPAGAAVPGARVILKHVQTSQQYATEAYEAGFYTYPVLQPGNYSLSIAAPGMQSWEGELVLQVGQTAVVDAALKLASTATEITVAGDVTPLRYEHCSDY